MLQEALEKPTNSPAEVALMLTTYVESELPAGGASAEKRFFELFPTLCERVFGVISSTDYNHELGGWMSRERRWEYNTASSSIKSSSQLGQAKSPSIRSDPVVLLLGTGRKSPASKEQKTLILIDAFAKEAEHRQNVRYDFPFLGLPKSIQDEWLAVIQTTLGGGWGLGNSPTSENSNRLFGSLFRASPREQTSLLMYQQTKSQKEAETERRPLQLNPLFSSPNTVRSPVALAPMVVDSPRKPKDDAQPKALLSMLEYYLLVFVRYPLAAPPPRSTPALSASQRPGSLPITRNLTPYGDTVYYELFKDYAEYYVPIRKTRASFDGFPDLERPSELFVRLVAALWLESRNQMYTTAKACAELKGRRGVDVSLDLCASFDLVKAQYVQLPSQVCRCLSHLIQRVAMDAKVANLSERITRDYSGKEDKLLCLSPTMEILHLPLYNRIRNTFRTAPIHGQDKNAFYYVLNDWLMWLEPWNTQYSPATKSASSAVSPLSKTKQPSDSRYIWPKSSQSSKYTPMWEAYIASNLHFYTVPLALFLRRARELDFSPKYYNSSVETVLRVLRVYSKGVVSVINRLLEVRNTGGSTVLNVPYAKMVSNHEKKLDAFAPPEAILTLSSLQDDMQNLLEEIHLQQSKNAEKVNFFDKMIDKAFGTGTQNKEQKDLENLTEKAKVIFGFPSTFVVAPLKGKLDRNNKDSAQEGHIRTEKGYYTENGLRRAAIGEIKCRPDEIPYIGNRMNAKPQTYEIAFLIQPLLNLSIKLNQHLGLASSGKPNSNRYMHGPIDLRFLADYRNLMCTILFLYFLWWCLFC
ncbi:hypothetical protein IV203_037850 [Nitzschia inconspicua]|uniref:Uncharacterized protein n=1 Tax=Nitzschia inconspicua TaxID=303405 RepID=A0A9K3PYS8_9STRA|nr:hypothetical protein IV203_037850 [Nitzschia inconspicua]